MKNEAQMYELVAELAAAKSRQDLAATLDIYHGDIELIVPGSDSHVKGAAEVAVQLDMFFVLFPDYTAVIDQYAFNESVMLATGQVFLTPDIAGKNCPRIQLPAFFEFGFQDNKISREVFVLDMGLLCKKADIVPSELIGQMKVLFADLHNKNPDSAGERL